MLPDTLHRALWAVLVGVGLSLPQIAYAAPAEPVIPLCGTNSSTPCGTSANPMFVTPSGGSGGTVTALPTTGTGGQNSVTVTNVSGQILALRTAPQYALSIKNESATASIAFCFGTSCTAALNTAGSITLAPGQLYSESATFIHLDRINGISSAATSPATIQAN